MMCAICGCSATDPHNHGESKGDGHVHREGGSHDHIHAGEESDATRILRFEAELLSRNDRIAHENRIWLEERSVVALNLIGAPGSGKTTLLEKTIGILSPSIPVSVLEGDQETEIDAKRIEKVGASVLQINTGTGCHLNARMIGEKLRELRPREQSLVFIENVGNLVCPGLFDIGEHAKIVVMSVTEGEEKPLKYPNVFREARALLLTKIDLLPYLSFDLDRCLQNARNINPEIDVFAVSATKGIGLEVFHEWIWRIFAQETALAGGG